MKYKNAGEILPSELVEEIQKYIQGAFLYIPKKDKQTHRAVTEYRIELEKRNNRIFRMHLEGMSNKHLAKNFGLAQSSIRRILIEQRKRSEIMYEKINTLLPHWGLQGESVTPTQLLIIRLHSTTMRKTTSPKRVSQRVITQHKKNK